MRHFDPKIILEWLITTRFVIIAPICAAVFYLGYLWDTDSLSTALEKSQQEEHNIKIQYEILLTKEASIKNDILQLPKLQEILKSWAGMLVKPAELPDLLNEILKLGTANHLQFKFFNPGAEVKQGDYIEVPIKVAVSGEYQGITAFITQISTMPWIVVVSNLLIATGIDANVKSVTDIKNPADLTAQAVSDNRVTAEMTLDVYHFYKPEKLINEKLKK
jgi:type IV pilus assembly protein PilO